MVSISVCIPTFNAADTILETLNSFLNQSKKPFVIKVFDNQSTDATFEIVKKIAANNELIKLFINETNLGGEGNFTKCLNNGEGDVTIVAHADDVYHQDFLSEIEKAFIKFPQAVATFTKARFIDGNSKILNSRFHPKEISTDDYREISFDEFLNLVFKYSNFITCPSVAVKTSVYQNQIKIWNGETYKTSADLDVWLRLSEMGSIISINKELIFYRFSTASYSFRIAKLRTTEHDFFKVIRHYQMKYPRKTKKLNHYFNFLVLKDLALININKMRQKKKVQKIKFSNELFLGLLSSMFKSSWHLKFSMAIVGAFFASTFYSLLGLGHEE